MKTIYSSEVVASRKHSFFAVMMLMLLTSVTAFAQCPTPPGSPAAYGTGSWIGYVYNGLDTNNPPQNAFTAGNYRGYITQSEQFDYDLGNGAPTASTVCGSYADSFSIRYRMTKNWPAGYYQITIGGDDGVRLSFDGGATWTISDWNYHSYQTATVMVYLSGNRDMVLESYDQGGQYRVSFNYTSCGPASTAPSGISGTNAICSGNSTTLTATGATLAAGGVYQWGTGTVIGNNIIAGQTGVSITVAPTANTTYWVRIVDAAPCSIRSAGVTQQVTVTPVSTAPTSISGTATICAGTSVTLTATSGTLATGSVYEWGTGTVGSNVIAGQTGVSISVAPTATTTYWVRRVNANGCGSTDAATGTVTVTSAPGDATSYGTDSWIGYVYSGMDGANPPVNAFVTYRGYITQPEQFDYNLGTAAMSAANVCGTYASNFAIRFKMTKNWTPGYYRFTVGGDDGYRFSMDGGATWTLSNYVDHSYTSSTTAQIYLSGSQNFVIEFYERGGDTRVTFSYVACTDFSSAPTSISGTTTICNGTSTTLTATNGYAGAFATYQWGTGTTVGNNIINGQTAVSITVSPTANTTYWVRRVDGTPCNLTTGGVTQLVTVTPSSTAPTAISPNNSTICTGQSVTLTAQNGTLAAGSVYEWGTGATGSNVIAGQTGISISVSPSATTTYWVRRTGPSPCGTTNAATTTVTVNPASTAPTSISGTNSLCNTNGGVTLSADGGTAAANSTYQWGTGSVVGTNPFGGNGQTQYVNPNTTTVYWVRRYDPSCNTYTSGVTVTVYKGSTGPYSIAGTGTVCANTATTLTAQNGTPGTGSVYQWGTGNVGGANVIAGQTGNQITVTPSATTTYWVRLVDQGTCPGTAAVFFTVNTYTAPTAPTSITGPSVLCFGQGGGNLTANGATTGSNGQYQWGTGAVGSNVFANYNPVYINPSVTTTYWVRMYDPTCNTYSAGVSYTVTANTASTNPGTITATSTTVCSGNSVTLTASGGTVGTGSVYNWGTGYTVGNNVIAGETGASITVSPTTQTVYWVRRMDPAPCNTQTQGPTIVINVNGNSSAPTSFTAASYLICSTGNTNLTANGATLATGGQYQFGSGDTPGQNILATQNNATYNVSPNVTTTYWVRTIDNACSAASSALFLTVNVSVRSTSPTGISTTATTICSGSSVTLTATGGALGTDGAYQWGFGGVGNNIIAGETGVSIIVSPTSTLTYWVRRVDTAPCNYTSNSATRQITVTAPATAPMSISGAPTATVCGGPSYTLTANGGAGSTVFEWGTGTVGSNVIAGQTGNQITVTPSATTTYWVRRVQQTPCSGYTSAATVTINITAVPGNPSVFGTNQWNVYGYATGDINLTSAIYAGYYIQNVLSFDTQNGTNSWNTNNSPSSSAGWNGCSVPNDNFTFVYKRKGFPCGTYSLALANWDDEVRVFVDGTLVFSCNNWNGGGGCNNGIITGSFNLTASSEIEVRVREYGGGANLKMDFTKTDVLSTQPTNLTANGTPSCSGATVTLTASGGSTGTNGTFQWGTGTVGSNIIAGATTASINVNPTANTTYWVRRIDSLCGQTTAAVTYNVVVPAQNLGTLSANQIVCRNSTPQNVTLTGNSGSVVQWQTADDAAFTVNVQTINNTTTTLTAAQIGSVAVTKYVRAVVNGACGVGTTASMTITVPGIVTYNGTWNGTPSQYTPIVVSANLTISSNITVCACQVTNNAVITVQPNATLIVQREVIIDPNANIIVENTGSVVQIEDSAANTGIATVKRNSAPMKNFDFTYWSSPVQGQTLHNLSPLTRFDKYYSFNPVTNAWVTHVNGVQVMAPGLGYIVRAPLDWSVTNAVGGRYPATFIGTMNSGIISTPFNKGAGTFNLIGNPYPSAIDIDLFLTDPANSNLVNGTIYLWTHNTAVSASTPGGAQYNYTADDYAKYNLTGGVRTANPSISGGAEPTGKVASGQGFFIETRAGLANGNYNVSFRNAMRVANQNGQFFRPAADQSLSTTQTEGLEKHRAWLSLHNADGAYDQMLVGYIESATNEKDRLFDGEIFNGGNFVSMYTILGTAKLSIQGRALPFDVNDVIPVGYKSSVAGTFTITLEHFDGLFDNQNVYLLDKSDMSYHNLSEAEYSFTTATGTFNARFELHFQTSALGVGDHTPDANTVYIVKNDKHIEVSSGNYNMTNIAIYDLTGKLVYDKKDINATLFSTKDMNIAAQVLIVKVTLDNDAVITKKVIMY
ncbi:T9SS sorting signal type C domain-containing protein [Flavobacterium sp.]|uniref:Ig-like domain-containing protein n=1 Tax=Flavobacterium sp. TaxID=239 RepID=UPI00120F07AB|nr:T9SS sorting signal type C domain-containing protein [Flavobacterium sp.]RZJ73283.1 MAG: T9SS sorting signal type C domain-containing protein [Flavobacterium sp.]